MSEHVCKGCGAPLEYAPPVDFFCPNKACQHDAEQALAAFRLIRNREKTSSNDEKIHALQQRVEELEAALDLCAGNIKAVLPLTDEPTSTQGHLLLAAMRAARAALTPPE